MRHFLLLAILFSILSLKSFGQRYFTEITFDRLTKGDELNIDEVFTENSIDFTATYIFNDKYIYQTHTPINDVQRDFSSRRIGVIPEKLNSIKVIIYAYAEGVTFLWWDREIYINDEQIDYIPIISSENNTQPISLNTYIFKDDQDRYHIYKATINVNYKVFHFYSTEEEHHLCRNKEIKFTLPENPLWSEYNLFYNNSFIKKLTQKDNTTLVSSFLEEGYQKPFSLTIKATGNNMGNNTGNYQRQLIVGRYIIFKNYNARQKEEIKERMKENNAKYKIYRIGSTQRVMIDGIISTDLDLTLYFDTPIKDVQFEKPYIKDNTVVIPDDKEGLNKNCNFILSGKTISQAYNAPNQKWIPEGKYQLQISDKNDIYCQVNLDAYVPKVEYNYLDDAKQHTHWHSKDYIQAINMKMYNDGQEYPSIDINPDSKYTNNFECIPGNNNEIKKDPIVVYNDNNAVIKGWDEKGDPIFNTYDDLYATPYYISCNPDLDSIIIVPNDIKHSIYTIISTQNVDDEKDDDETDDDETDDNEICKLKEYPPITVDFLEDKPAHCSYDTLKVNIKSITGGLTDGKLTTSFNDFKYQLKLYNTNNEEIPQPTETTTIPKDGIINIPNYNHKEYKYTLQFYDAIISDEDAEHGGKEARSFTTSEKQVVMPEALFIPEPTISRPLCTFDSNGSIAINSAKVTLTYPNESAIYTWRVKYKQEDSYESLNMSEPIINNIPAGFYEVELNNDGCIATSSYELKDYPLLKFESTTSSNAKCYGYSDGSIFISVKGGTGEHRYFWNVGATSKDLLNIPKGDYQLTVWDAHECNIQTDTIKITEPTKVENNFIAHDYSICQDSELEIDAGTFADYEWKDPQGKTLKAKSILTLNNASPEGEYYLKTIRKDKCFAEDFINITQSKESLKMNFLLPSDIYNDDYAKIVETSSHELDSLKWSFSENLIGDFPKDSTTLTISTNALDKLSTYKIKLTGYYKGCVSTVTKNLNISNLTRPEEEYIPDFYDSDEILDCRIGPNPNNGNFTLFLDLDCAKDAVLTIYSISSYKYVLREKLVGLQNYEHSINQNLQQGLYILEVKTPKSIRRIKFEVTR